MGERKEKGYGLGARGNTYLEILKRVFLYFFLYEERSNAIKKNHINQEFQFQGFIYGRKERGDRQCSSDLAMALNNTWNIYDSSFPCRLTVFHHLSIPSPSHNSITEEDKRRERKVIICGNSSRSNWYIYCSSFPCRSTVLQHPSIFAITPKIQQRNGRRKRQWRSALAMTFKNNWNIYESSSPCLSLLHSTTNQSLPSHYSTTEEGMRRQARSSALAMTLKNN